MSFFDSDAMSIAFQKKKGTFHHSSFLAGGATLAAGRLEAENGTLKVFYYTIQSKLVETNESNCWSRTCKVSQ